MKRRFLMMIASVLLVAGGTQASIGWTQGFGIGAVNQVDWLGGVGSADAVNKVTFDQIQEFNGFRADIAAFQRGRGMLFQNATVSGATEPATSRQDATINGSQNLATYRGMFPLTSGTSGQQSLTANLTNQVVQPSGVGHVNGIQNFVGSQEQSATTPFGTSTQAQYVETMQRGSITTSANTDPTVTSTINLQLDQSQITHGF